MAEFRANTLLFLTLSYVNERVEFGLGGVGSTPREVREVWSTIFFRNCDRLRNRSEESHRSVGHENNMSVL